MLVLINEENPRFPSLLNKHVHIGQQNSLMQSKTLCLKPKRPSKKKDNCFFPWLPLKYFRGDFCQES